jgi:adenylate cyclase
MVKETNRRKTKTRAENATTSTGVAARLLQVEMLLDIAKTVAAFETLDEMLAKLVELTSEVVNAERGTIFLHDKETCELYSRVAQGDLKREIRFLDDSGIAGHVFTTGKPALVHDAYSDKRFNRNIDESTGFSTKCILCVPIKTVKDEIVGVAQLLNKKKGRFLKSDMDLLGAMTTQVTAVLQSAQAVEQMQKAHRKEMEFFDVVSDLTSEIDLQQLLLKVMAEATRMLNCERSTLFLNDEKTGELFSHVAEGMGTTQIRIPNNAGIAGVVFTSGETINIPHAYADLRFNPAVDKQTGFFTRSMICVPIINKSGKTIGVTQALNKHGGPFTTEDEARLRAFTAQVSISLENAKLFDDIQNMKKYSDGMLQSMSNGVITLDEDGKIVTINEAGLRILRATEEEVIERTAEEFFDGPNAWIIEKIRRVEETETSDVTMDADMEFGGEKLSVNITVLPLLSVEHKRLGSMIMIEDISSEKRMKSTMSRYLDPGLADKLLLGQSDFLGGQSTEATILFSDMRGFTPLTEELGAAAVVDLLNEYFTMMVECVQDEGGMLDKFIADALMAAFGTPIAHEDDEDRAVRAAVAMINKLNEWNVKRAAEGKKPVKIGIGLNTDQVISGNIGSPKRMDYTLIGDGVNLASRLESACKQYSVSILVADNTVKKLRGTYRMREIDRVVVKGKSQPVDVYEILDYHTDETFPNLMEAVNNFNYGVQQYRKANWDQAVETFNQVLRLNERDEVARIYIKRCQFLKENPPADDWQGEWVLESK